MSSSRLSLPRTLLTEILFGERAREIPSSDLVKVTIAQIKTISRYAETETPEAKNLNGYLILVAALAAFLAVDKLLQGENQRKKKGKDR